jgi:replicative DNA helicase
VDALAASEVERPRHLADILARKRKLRELIRLGSRLIHEAGEEQEPEAILAGASSDLANMADCRGESGPVFVGNVTDEVLARLTDETQGMGVFGARTGFYRFDGITRGLKPGELVILAARPGIGKSTLALNWALRASRRGAVPVFSLEMSREEVARKMLTDACGFSLRDLDRDRFAELSSAKAELDALPVLIDDRAGITVRQIRQKLERIQTRQRVVMVVIDYLQLISSPTDSRGAKQNEAIRIGEISRELKLMAKDCGVPVVVLSQLNREVEKRQNGKPQLSDLRDSGCIEQDADMVVFIHRKTSPNLPPELQDKGAELIIAKHRNGPCGMVPLVWRGEISRYEESERSTESSETEYRPGVDQEIPFEELV